MVGKLTAALDERCDPNLAIIARCEERSSEAALIERLVTYAETGVDALWSSGFKDDLIRQVRAQARGIPFIGIAADSRPVSAAGVRIAIYLAAGTAMLPAFPRVASALDYPTRPVRLVVGFPAGLTPDITARIVGQELSERLGRQIIVDNRPGKT